MPLDSALVRGLLAAAEGDGGTANWATQALVDSLRRAADTQAAGVSDPAGTADLFRRASIHAVENGYSGLLIVVDEFGKFLERAGRRGELPDLIAAQYLAELASSIDRSRILFIVLVHQAFQNYASSLSQAEWLEWVKSQGRFREVLFAEPPDEQYDLVASSLHPEKISERGAARVRDWAENAWRDVADLDAFKSESAERWISLAEATYPLHSLALYALPRLSSRVGQNERTLFTFVASDDPLSLSSAVSAVSSGTSDATITLDYLYDYFIMSANRAAVAPEVQRNIYEAEVALERGFKPFRPS